MINLRQLAGKFIYSIIFIVLLPALIVVWAEYTESIIALPVIQSTLAGTVFMFLGGALMLWGMFALQFYGKGLPMNAYPPPVFVIQGPYRLFRHPIYWGFGLMMTGYFLFTGSNSGIWMVAPLTILGMVALVLGYEALDLKKRFPGQHIRTVLDYPESKSAVAEFREKLPASLWVVAYLILSNFMISKMIGMSPSSFEVLPLQATSLQKLSFLTFIYLFVIPFMLDKKDNLRDWEITSFIGLSISAFVAFLYPGTGAQYLPSEGNVLYIVPVFLILISLRSLLRQSTRLSFFLIIIGFSLMFIQLINSTSILTGFFTSVVIYLVASHYLKIWIFLRNTSEKIANSWKEWIIGYVRIINHGFYVGFGAFLGVMIAGTLAGSEYAVALLVFVFIVNICAALWAQIIEGSAKLKRPFGYYGGIVGIIFGSLAVWLIGLNAWVILGVVSVVMPWTQAIGRFRCLVNGCCHGRKTDNPVIGIRYFHPRSRVCNISGLKGELVHPTQLYAILWLTVLGFFLLNLWNRGYSPALIFGLYLILTSLGRFVEEAYRGEVQTPVFGGLHLYQWTAIISILTGIIMTMIPVTYPQLNPGFNWETLLVATISGLFVFFAMGVDFPYSNVRFSRLV